MGKRYVSALLMPLSGYQKKHDGISAPTATLTQVSVKVIGKSEGQ